MVFDSHPRYARRYLMGEKVMVDFPAFVTRDSEKMWLLVHDDSHLLLSNSVIAELYKQMLATLGYRKTMKIMYDSAKKGTHDVQREIMKAYNLSVRSDVELRRRIASIPFYIQTYGHGRGRTVTRGDDFIFRVKHSSLAEHLKNSNPEGPVCAFVAGFFAGMAEVFASSKKPAAYTCVERKCIALGDPFCEFKLSPSRKSPVTTKRAR
jgi:predicted hydrocarbon binding protein